MNDPKELKEKFLTKTLNFLSYKPRSEYEVRQKLERLFRATKNIPENVNSEALINEIVEDLKNDNLIDDARYTKMIVDSYKLGQSGKKNIYQIKQFLYKKGINKSYLNELTSDDQADQEFVLAKRLVLKKQEQLLKSSKKLSKSQIKNQIIKSLLSKGFAYQTILAVFDSIS